MGWTRRAFRSELAVTRGAEPDWPIGAFPDLEQSVRDSVERLGSTTYLAHRDAIRGFATTSSRASCRKYSNPDEL